LATGGQYKWSNEIVSGVRIVAAVHTSTLLRHIRRLGQSALALTDRQLVERFALGRDEAAFAELVARHGALVLNVCRQMLRHEQDAADAFQAAFLVLAEKAATIRNGESVAGWLYGVAWTLCVPLSALVLSATSETPSS
jgi:hypothetical protein